MQIELTAREFALAEFLLRRKGQLVSKNTIAEHVWDAELDVDSNVIEVYIGYLRRKLDRPFGRDDIQTVRGLGYRLQDRPTIAEGMVMVPAPGKAPRMRWGIRARVTTLTALVVALTLVLSAIALAALVRQSLVAGLDDALISRAESVAAQARTATSSDIPGTPRQDSLVQVLDANGR